MIIGIGTDLIEIERVVKACSRRSFINKLFTTEETEWFGENYSRAADNFAVKEAVAKAMGVGFGSDCWPNEIEVLRDERGKPYIRLYGKSAATARRLGIENWYISITNTKEYASTFAVAEGNNRAIPDITGLLPPRKADSNKGTYGRVFIVAGSENMTGAAFLCTMAAYRTGAGLVETLTMPDAAVVIRNRIPEALCTVRTGDLELDLKNMEKASIIVVGPGLGTGKEATELVMKIIQKCSIPLVLDADALNILADFINTKNITGIRDRIEQLNRILPANTILTPHVKELSRLLGVSVQELKSGLFDIAYEMTYNNKLIFVCKDSRTVVACENSRYINKSGNNGMATGGSGDVLTGIIAGMIAGGYDPKEAAEKGVYLHGLCGDEAAGRLGEHSMMAGDIIDSISICEGELQRK